MDETTNEYVVPHLEDLGDFTSETGGHTYSLNHEILNQTYSYPSDK